MAPVNIVDNYYNLTELLNSSSLGDMMVNIAHTTGDSWGGFLFGSAILLIIFSVSFLYMKGLSRFSTSSILLSALTLTGVTAIFLFSMTLIGPYILWFILFAWIAQLMHMMFTHDG
jgi:hypothetical protein